MMENRREATKGFSIVLIIAIGAIIATFGWVAYASWQQSVDNSTLTLTIPFVKHGVKAVNTNSAANTNTSAQKGSNPTADWKTYSNTTYQYSIKYPDAYAQTGAVKKIQLQKGTLSGDTTHRVLVYTYDGTDQGWSAEEKSWFTWALQGFPTSTTFVNRRTVTLGSNSFTVFDFDPASGGGLTVNYFLVKGSKVYMLSDFRVGDHSNDANKDIISTFAVDAILGWKTYTNTAYHFSVRYPSDWQAVEDSSTSPFHINLSRKNGTSQGSITILARYPNSTSGVAGNENAVSTTRKVTVGSKMATEYNWTVNGRPISRAIIFDALPPDWPDDNPDLEPSNTERYISVGPAADGSYTLVNQILSTFTFDETLGWKTYENAKYGYSFKYPSGWTLSEFTYNGADEPLSGDGTSVVDPQDKDGSFMVCPDGRGADCIPFQDGEYTHTTSAVTVGGRDGTKTTYAMKDCPTCRSVNTITFTTRPSTWGGGRDFRLANGTSASDSVLRTILSTFIFTQ